MYYARNSYHQRCCIALMQKCVGKTFIIFDTETTGLDPQKDYIIELAAMKYQIRKNQFPELIEQLNLYMKPPVDMEQKVIDIHHITNEFLQDKPSQMDCIEEINDFFGESPIMLGYNVDFDKEMLFSFYQRAGRTFHPEAVLDVMEMGYDLCFGQDFKDHKLETLIKVLGLDAGLEFHNALDDTIATYRLFLYCYDEYQRRRPLNTGISIYVNSIYFWKGYRKEQSGVYLNTNLGIIFYSTFLKRWCSSQVVLTSCNIDEMEKYVLRKLNISQKELGKMTQKKFNLIKEDCKERGVYL